MDRDKRAMWLAGAAVLATIFGGYAMAWFHVTAGEASSSIDLHGQTLCTAAGACHRTGLSGTGLFDDNALLTLWGSVLFAVFVVVQVGLRLLRGYANAKWIKKGYFWGVTMCGTVLTTSYLFPPEPSGVLLHGAVERTWAPLVLAIGQIAGLVATFYATDSSSDDDVGEYKPVIIAGAQKAAKPPTAL